MLGGAKIHSAAQQQGVYYRILAQLAWSEFDFFPIFKRVDFDVNEVDEEGLTLLHKAASYTLSGVPILWLFLIKVRWLMLLITEDVRLCIMLFYQQLERM